MSRGEKGGILYRRRARTHAAAERFHALTLNLAELEYISSTGLRVLRRVYLAMHHKGGALYVSNVSKSVMEVFEMTGFASMLQFA